jgi:hypothetical protein
MSSVATQARDWRSLPRGTQSPQGVSLTPAAGSPGQNANNVPPAFAGGTLFRCHVMSIAVDDITHSRSQASAPDGHGMGFRERIGDRFFSAAYQKLVHRVDF